MYEVTDRFKEAVRQPHTQIALADLYSAGELIATLPIISGSVTDDADALQRRRCQIEFPGISEVLDLLPTNAPVNRGLWPIGNEIRIRAGIDYGDGTSELVSMGWFRIAKPHISEDADGITVKVDGYDHGRTISRARFTMPYTINEGTLYHVAIKDLIKSRMRSLKDSDFIFLSPPNFTTPQLTFTQDDDPWGKAVDMATSLGCELFWNGDRKVVLRTEPDPEKTPSVFDYIEGEEATFDSIERELDDDQTYNGVIVSGEASTNVSPIRAEAWDTDPNSPTYYDPNRPDASKYGAVPYFITSQYVTTFDQAAAAAEANLIRVFGVVESVQFNGVVNYAHEANDVVKVQRRRINVDSGYILSSITMPFGGESQSAVTRKRRVR